MRVPRRHTGRHARPRTRRVGSARSVASRLGATQARPRRSMRGHLGRAGVRIVARTLVAAAVLIGLANLTTSADLSPGPSATPLLSPAQMQLMKRFDCSPDGFGDGSQPRSAIIRSEDGDLRVVSFDRGWQVYTGARPHALVAVCHAPPR
jgi:hypothetical protein